MTNPSAELLAAHQAAMDAAKHSVHLHELQGDPDWFDSHPLVIAQRARPQTIWEWYGELWEEGE